MYSKTSGMIDIDKKLNVLENFCAVSQISSSFYNAKLFFNNFLYRTSEYAKYM